jgi:replicative DNA helicase
MNAAAKSIDAGDRFANEVELIGACLSHSAIAYRQAAAIVAPEHFNDVFHAKLFALTGHGVDAGLEHFKLVHWVISRLRDDAAVAELTVPASALVAGYIARAAPLIGVEGCARQVKHDWLRDGLKAAVEQGDTEAAEACAAEMERLSAAHLERGDGVQAIGGVAETVLSNIGNIYQSEGRTRDFAFAGSADLARTIVGWRRKRLYVIAGRPGMGKSTLALSWLLRVAAKGHGVMLFSLEEGREEVTEKALCDLAYDHRARVEYADLTVSGVVKAGFEEKFEAIARLQPMLHAMPFGISDDGGLTLAQIRSAAMRFARELSLRGKRLDVVCVDHLNLVKASDRYSGNKVAETEEVSSGLKQLAKELDCAVVATCQLSRAVEGRDDKRPALSDLRWAGSIEQDADCVMLLYREAYYLERRKHDDIEEEQEREARLARVKNILEVNIAKNRGGPCRLIEFFADMACAAVRDKGFYE